MNIRLLHPDEVLRRWEDLRRLLALAVEQGRGELAVDDIRKLVLNGRMFLLGGFDDAGTLCLAVTAEVVVYPRKTVLLVGFGSGKTHDAHTGCMLAVRDLARRAGADCIQTYCQNPAMVRYHQRFFGAQPAYTVMEMSL